MEGTLPPPLPSLFFFWCVLSASKAPRPDVPLSHNQSWEPHPLGAVEGVREVVRSLERPQRTKVRIKTEIRRSA